MVTLPIASNNFYTIEYRRWTGLDTNVPGQAVEDLDQGLEAFSKVGRKLGVISA